MQKLASLFLALGLCTTTIALAAPPESAADQDFEQEMARTRMMEDVTPGVRQLSLDGPIALSKSSSLPYGFQQKDIAPPFRLGVKLDPTLSKRQNAGLWLDADLDFLQTNLAPILDLALGWKIKIDHWYVFFGGQITDQQLPKNGPIHQSQFDTTYFGLIAGVGYHDSHWDTRLKLKSVFYSDAQIAGNEGIETDVAHDATFIENLTVTYSTGFGLKGLAGVDLYNFGKTGIVSKEFAYGYDTHNETRFRVGASYDIAPFTVRAEARFTAGVGDQIENSYSAVFLNDDYVLSPVVLILGVAWNF
jgi:hypothetical protein